MIRVKYTYGYLKAARKAYIKKPPKRLGLVKHKLCSCWPLHVSFAIALYSDFVVSCMKQNSEILTIFNITFCINIHVYT